MSRNILSPRVSVFTLHYWSVVPSMIHCFLLPTVPRICLFGMGLGEGGTGVCELSASLTLYSWFPLPSIVVCFFCVYFFCCKILHNIMKFFFISPGSTSLAIPPPTTPSPSYRCTSYRLPASITPGFPPPCPPLFLFNIDHFNFLIAHLYRVYKCIQFFQLLFHSPRKTICEPELGNNFCDIKPIL